MCQKWLQAPNILANSPYWAFQLLVGQAMAIPSGTEFPAGNYCHCDHPRFSAPHPSLSYPEFNLSAHSSIKITLKLFLEPSPPPKLSHPAGRKKANQVIARFPSFPAVIDEILTAREWRCCRWLARKIQCTQIPSSPCNYFLWGKWFLLPDLQAGNAEWSVWEVLFKAEHSCFAQMGEKKWGKNKAERQRERISINGKDLINKNRSITTLWACKMSVNSLMI